MSSEPGRVAGDGLESYLPATSQAGDRLRGEAPGQRCQRTGLTHNPVAGGRRGGGVPSTTTRMRIGPAGWVGARGGRRGAASGSAAVRSVAARS